MYKFRSADLDGAYSDDVDAYMDRYGFVNIGTGAGGRVYAQESKPDNVVKVFQSYDNGYKSFIDFACRHPGNPHLPRFRGKCRMLTPEWFAIRIERLDKIKDPDLREAIYPLPWSISKQIEKDGPNQTPEQISAKLDIPAFTPILISTIIDLEEHRRQHNSSNAFPYGWDMHHGNAMMRGNTLVITDPFI